MFLIPKIHLYPFLPGQCNELLGSAKLLQGRNHSLFIPKLRTMAVDLAKNKYLFLFSNLVSLSYETPAVNVRQIVFPVTGNNI